MYPVVKFIHSYWAYLVVVVLLIAVGNVLSGFLSKRYYQPKDFRIALFTLIVTHIQLLIGLVLYFISPLGIQAFFNYGIKTVMKTASLRFYAVEHLIVMIAVVVLVTVGYSKHKAKRVSGPKFKLLVIFYTLAFILLLTRIPWYLWFN